MAAWELSRREGIWASTPKGCFVQQPGAQEEPGGPTWQKEPHPLPCQDTLKRNFFFFILERERECVCVSLCVCMALSWRPETRAGITDLGVGNQTLLETEPFPHKTP